MTVLFGVDHSPWTQAAVLAHAAHGVSVRLRPYPSLGYYLESGVVLPVCWRNGTQTADSLAIIETLLPVADAQQRAHLEADFTDLESLFLAYALDRTGPGRRLRFIQGWATINDVPTTPVSIAFRAVLCWYFFVLIEVGRWMLRKRRNGHDCTERLTRQLLPWVTRLEEEPFLGGDEPNASDFGLLGHLECMSSGLTDWAMNAAAQHPALVAWLQRMHARIEHHPTVYSRRIFDPAAGPQPPSERTQQWFYACMALWVVVWPLTFPLLTYASSRRHGAPNRTGGRLEAQRYRR